MKNLIVPLNSKWKKNLNIDLLGGKGINLLKLFQYGYPIASGFIITTEAFGKLNWKPPRVNLTSSENLDSHNEEIISNPDSSLIIDPVLAKIIAKKLQKLPGTYAVRSSMVGEDQVNASFAGQLDTFLNVEAEHVLSAIEKCYLSLYKPNAQQYISDHNSDQTVEEHKSKAMAVIIQQMVQPVFSGVAFTANPINGRREFIIEAIAGYGERIVSEGITPDRYIVNSRGKIERMMPLVKDGPLLSSEQILQLAESANRIATHMGFPQDIEWVWDGKHFVFLQTRPITTINGKNIYSSKLMADMSPGLVKPLQWSTCSQAMVIKVFGRLFTEIIGANDLDFKQSIRLIHSRLYANMTFFEKLLTQVGLPMNFFEMITRDETGQRKKPPLTFRLLYVSVFRLVPFIWKYARINDQMNAFLVKQDSLLEKYRKTNWSQAGVHDKYQQFIRLLDLHTDAQWHIIISSFNMSIRNTILKKMVRRHAPSVESSDLIKGLYGLQGLEPNRVIEELSRQLKQLSADTIKLCADGNSEAIRKELSTSEAGQKLLADFYSFMNNFGHYSANTTNFTEKRWIENESMIWSMIGNGALKDASEDLSKGKKIWVEKKNEVMAHLSILHKPLFSFLLNSTVRYLNLKEKISLMLSEDTYQIRRLTLSIGDDLVKKGLINKPEDIYYLYFDELELILNENSDVVLKEKVAERTSRLEADANIIPEDTICGDHVIPVCSNFDDPGVFLSGICGSSGCKKGYALVVQNPGDVMRTLTSDDILVVPFSHVGWTLLFSHIGGIVAETGGQLSHTSIMAREYSIPALVNVPGATQLIKTGQPLTLDADHGRVYLKHTDEKEGGLSCIGR